MPTSNPLPFISPLILTQSMRSLADVLVIMIRWKSRTGCDSIASATPAMITITIAPSSVGKMILDAVSKGIRCSRPGVDTPGQRPF